MAITYSTNLKFTLIGTGDQAGTWGNTTNTNIGTLIEQSIAGYVSQTVADSAGSPTSLSIADGTDSVARNMVLVLQGSLSAARDLILPTNKKLYFIHNNTSGGFAVTAKCSGQTGVSIPAGAKVILACDGTDIVEAFNYSNGLILPSSATIATLSGTTLGYGSASLTNASAASLTATNLASTSATITTLKSTSATIDTLSGTTIGTTASSTIRGASGFIGQLTATSSTITTLTVTSSTITTLKSTSATIDNLTVTSLNASITLPSSATIATLSGTTLGYASASLTTVTGTTFGTTGTTQIRGASGAITTLTGTTLVYGSASLTTVSGARVAMTSGTITSLSSTSAAIGKFNAGSSSVDSLFASGVITVDGAAHTNPSALSFAASSMAVDCALSNVFTVTMTANITAAPVLSNAKDGQTINWFFTQDGTGGRTAIWPSSFKWPGGSTGVLSTTSSSVDLLVATYRSATTAWYAALTKDFR